MATDKGFDMRDDETYSEYQDRLRTIVTKVEENKTLLVRNLKYLIQSFVQ